mmetsp:Transcript_14691/g.46203  ORF Transcript_14691/g.46203 Transcript_14691/m.46203 type:complete len:206 (+) Transcript_14691:595-1212(+)
MAEISAMAAKGESTPGSKRRKSQGTRIVQEDDYRPSDVFAVAQVPREDSPESVAAGLGRAGAPDAERLAETCTELRELLRRRGFPPAAELLVAFARGAAEPQERLPRLLSGVYHLMPERFEGRPCYQKIWRHGSGTTAKAACVGLYFFWSTSRGGWKLGPLSDDKAGFAFCGGDRSGPAEVEGPWLLLREEAVRPAAAGGGAAGG